MERRTTWGSTARASRVALGRGRRWPVPDRPVLRPGDTAGFWRVLEAGPVEGGHHLLLEAAVRAPGTVRLSTRVTPEGPRCCLVAQTVTFTPSGLLGRAYLLTDVPARETLMELVHRRILRDLERAVAWSPPRPGTMTTDRPRDP